MHVPTETGAGGRRAPGRRDSGRRRAGNLHDHGVLEPVALCCAATLSSGGFFQQNLTVDSFHAAAAGAAAELRAAVVPHVALQLMPDVRPLLPRLHGFFTRPDGTAAGRERLWLAYDPGETSLAAHLDSRPTTAITTKATVPVPTLPPSPPRAYRPRLPSCRNRRLPFAVCTRVSALLSSGNLNSRPSPRRSPAPAGRGPCSTLSDLLNPGLLSLPARHNMRVPAETLSTPETPGGLRPALAAARRLGPHLPASLALSLLR